MANTITEELQNRLNYWCNKLNKTSIVAVQNEEDGTFDITMNVGEGLTNGFISIVAAMYVSCDEKHREDMAESMYDLLDEGIRRGRVWVKNNESK